MWRVHEWKGSDLVCVTEENEVRAGSQQGLFPLEAHWELSWRERMWAKAQRQEDMAFYTKATGAESSPELSPTVTAAKSPLILTGQLPDPTWGKNAHPSTYPIAPQFSSVQLLSHVWLFASPWTVASQASLSITNSQTLLKLMSIESVMTSNHLILCRPLFLPPSIFPSIRVFSNESVLCIRWPKYWSFSFQSF